MEVVQMQQKIKKAPPGQEVILAGDPKNPVAVPANLIPPQPVSNQQSGGLSQNDEAVDPFGAPMPLASREEIAIDALTNLVASIEKMFNQDKFKQILKAAKTNGVYLTKEDHNIGRELEAAKTLLGL
jgi:hypothetical protein